MFHRISKLIEAWQNRRRRKQAAEQLIMLLMKQRREIEQTMQKLAAIKKDYQ